MAPDSPLSGSGTVFMPILVPNLTTLKVHSHYTFFFLQFCLQFDANAKNGFYTHALRLTQHPHRHNVAI